MEEFNKPLHLGMSYDELGATEATDEDIKKIKENFCLNDIGNIPESFIKNDEESQSDGCGEDGLHSCPIHPKLNLLRRKIINEQNNLSDVSTKSLLNEIHRRQLQMKLSGKVIISSDKISFEIDKLHWPLGVYYVTIECIEEEITNPQECKGDS